MDDGDPSQAGGDVLSEIVMRLIDMNNHLGQQIVALQAVCGYLIAENCRNSVDPKTAMEQVTALLSGTGIGLADKFKQQSASEHYDTKGATEVFERISSIVQDSLSG